ncbi:GTP binding protein Cdc42 [Mycena albidolilacea]|uniref:GTP binding protein Cdc42 n=1 Tax=Mycena albidolilacea TaxID=1033008 RepID=A0AAD7AHQ0_9AGAR|nr:GTP binding protein Cdc42 [Mycena albidolilacea]
MNYLKLVVVGDNLVGKTCLLISYVIQKFPEYIPTNFDPGSINIKVGDDIYCLAFFEASFSSHISGNTYPSDEVLIAHVVSKYPGEVASGTAALLPRVAVIVVATQIDLRADEQTVQNMARGGQLPVTISQGEKLARDVGAAKYVECSTKTLEGVASVLMRPFLQPSIPRQ